MLDNVRRLKVCDYIKTDPGTGVEKMERGVIAQELKSVLPHAVEETKVARPDGSIIDDLLVVDDRAIMMGKKMLVLR